MKDPETTRINKFLADKGHSTRRGADALVLAGKVFINGKKAVIGDKVGPDDTVTVKENKKTDIKYVYYAYNKAIGVVTTMPGPGEKDIVHTTKFPEKVFPIGRLDKDSHGLIIMTNDGRVTDRLLNPTKDHEKEYIVRVDKPFNDAFLLKLSRGVKFEKYTTAPAETKKLKLDTFSIILTEGKNRQIRKMCQLFNRPVKDLNRVRIMNIELGKLAPGGYRKIAGKELETFLGLLGLEN